MRLKIRKIIAQIRRQEFGNPQVQQSQLSHYLIQDPGDRRRAHAPLMLR